MFNLAKKTFISRVLTFVFIWTLIIPNVFTKADIQKSILGFYSVDISKQDGKRVAEVFLDYQAKQNLKNVKLHTKVEKYNYETGVEYVQGPTWNLQLNEEDRVVGYLEEKDISLFGYYYIDKIELIYDDNSKKVVFNSMFYSELGENDKENAELEYYSNIILYEENPLTISEGNFEKKTVVLGEEQVFSFKISSNSEVVQPEQIYVTFNRSDINNNESTPIVVLASHSNENIYQAKVAIKGSLNTGEWRVEKIDITDNFGRNFESNTYFESFKVISENTDITPPELVSINLTGDTYDCKLEERPTFIIEATDDLSGVKDNISIVLVDKENKDNTIDLWLNKEWEGEKFIGYINLYSIKANGTYEIRDISIEDNANNSIKYVNSKYKDDFYGYNCIEKDFNDLELNIINFEEGTDANISIEQLVNNKSQVTNGNELDYSITVKSDKKVNGINMYFTNDNGKTLYLYAYNYDETEDGYYTFKIKPNEKKLEYLASGSYRVEYISLGYDYGNNIYKSVYFYDVRTPYLWEDYETYDFKELDFVCENENEDFTPPNITKITLDKEVITPGETVEIKVEVEDDNSGFIYNEWSTQWAYINYNNTNNSISLQYDRDEKLFKGNITIPSYASTGIYNISSINLYDVADNYQYYSWWNEEDKTILSQGTILVKSDLNEQLPPTITCNVEEAQSYKAPFTPVVSTDHGDISMLLNGREYDGSPIEKAGNYNLFITAKGVDGSITTKKIYFTIIVEINNETTSDEIIDHIQNSEDNNVVIEVNSDEKTISENIFEAIKGTDKVVSFSQKNEEGKEEVVWTFEGKDIVGSFGDIKLSVSNTADEENKENIENIDEEAYVIHFDHHGELPGKATVKVYVGLDNKLSGKDLTFYYFNSETGQPEKIQGPLAIDNEGYVTVEITHCSDYFLSENEALDPNDQLPVILVDKVEVELKVGEKIKLNVEVNPPTVEVIYSSLNESIVNINSDGEIEAIGAGETDIKIEAGKSIVYVKVKVDTNGPVVPEEPQPEEPQPEEPQPEEPQPEEPQPEEPQPEEPQPEEPQPEEPQPEEPQPEEPQPEEPKPEEPKPEEPQPEEPQPEEPQPEEPKPEKDNIITNTEDVKEKLPQTGGKSNIITLAFGLLLIGAGVYNRRKK